MFRDVGENCACEKAVLPFVDPEGAVGSLIHFIKRFHLSY